MEQNLTPRKNKLTTSYALEAYVDHNDVEERQMIRGSVADYEATHRPIDLDIGSAADDVRSININYFHLRK